MCRILFFRIATTARGTGMVLASGGDDPARRRESKSVYQIDLLMNQCLEGLPSDSACPAGHALSLGGGAPMCDGNDRVQGEVSPATSSKGKVLLLDDDPDFKDVISGFLADSGYTVVAVQNGAQGIREVLAGDFALILCDMRMPTVPGDVFYRAVERVRPHQSRRFVFMTGSRDEAETNDFIESVSGFLIRKPFHLNDLLNWISVIEVCGSFQSVFEPVAAASVLQGIREATDPCMATVAQLQASMIAAERPAPLSVGKPDPRPLIQADAAPRRPSRALSAGEPPRSVTRASPAVAHGGLARFLVLPKRGARAVLAVFVALTSAFFVGWRANLEERYSVLSVDLAAAEREWTAISKKLPEAERARDQIQALLSCPKRIEEDRAAPRWTWTLPTVATSRQRQMELQGLHARQMVGAPGACELRIDCVSYGPDARATADSFRRKIEEELQRGQNSAPVKTGFLRFADEPNSSSALSNQQGVSFEVVATVGIQDPAVFKHAIRY